MEKVSLNEFKDCIVDEQNNIVAEKPRWFDRHHWEQGEMLVNAFNKKLNLANVSGSFSFGDDSKNVEFLNYYDGTIEISINEYGNEQTKMLSVEETQNLINWLINNCR